MRKQNFRLIMGLLLYMCAAYSAPTVQGQELLVPPSGAALSLGSGTREAMPTIELPALPSDGSGTRNIEPIAEPIPEPVIQGELQPGFDSPEADGSYRIFDYEPAILESTGTWLRRGFWYAEVDALILDQIRERNDRTLAAELFPPAFIPGTVTPVAPVNPLVLEGGQQGAEGVPRIKLGRFLFRDHKNRDHNAELSFYGGGQWSQAGRLDALPGNVLDVSDDFDGSGINPSFAGATSMQFDLDSRFNSVELNYHVKSRMQKDRMEMAPSGRWVRRGQPSITRSLIAGIRYFDLNEDFDWDAFGIDADADPTTAPESGNYQIRTDNDLIGTQIGFTWNYERPRWSLGLSNKSGVYLNHTDVNSSFAVTGGGTSGNNDIQVDNLSFIIEGGLLGKYHVKQNFSIRAGFELLYVSSIAQATDQINFIPVSTSQVVADADSTFMGATIGFEGYW